MLVYHIVWSTEGGGKVARWRVNGELGCPREQCCGSVTFLVRFRVSDQWIRILPFSSFTFKMSTKNFFPLLIIRAYYFLMVHLHHFQEKSQKEVAK